MISNGKGDDIINLSGTIAAGACTIGVLVTVVSFFGCFGAANEKGVLLRTYFALLIILMVLELSVGIAAYVKKDEIPNLLGDAWIKSVSDNSTTSLRGIIQIENTFKCCGFNDINSYAVPADCAIVNGWTRPCFYTVTSTMVDSLNIIAGSGVGIAVIQLIGLIFSAFMFVKIAKRDRNGENLLNESWRINRDKIQYGYASYNYA